LEHKKSLKKSLKRDIKKDIKKRIKKAFKKGRKNVIKKQHKKKMLKKSNFKIKIIKIMFKNHKNDIKIFNSPINCKRDRFIHA